MAGTRNKLLCGAKKRQGPGCCSQVAGWGTDHVGEGRCKLHGGASRIKSGRWSRIHRESLRGKVEAFRQTDADPLDLVDDLALIRALTVDYLDRCQAEPLADLDPVDRANAQGPDARQQGLVLDAPTAARLIETGSRIAQRIHRIRKTGAITQRTFRRLQEEMARIVARHVQDRETLRAIGKEWGEIRL